MKKNTQMVSLPQPQFWQKYVHIILCVVAFLLYVNTIGNGYNMDDELVTRKHKLTSKGISAIPEIFSSPYYSDNMGYSYEYRPVVLASFAIEHQFFGDRQGVSHFFNVLLYVLTVLVLFRLLKQLFHSYSYWLSIIAVLLFIFHPLHTEAIASIKNRDEILSLLFGLGAWWFAIKYTQSGKIWNLPLICLLFLLGLLSKMSIAPFVLLIPVSILMFFKPKGYHILVIGSLLSFILLVLALISFSFTVEYIYLIVFVAILPYLFWLVITEKYKSFFKNIKAETLRVLHAIKGEKEKIDVFGNYKIQKISIHFKEILNILFLVKCLVFAVGIFMSVYTENKLWLAISYIGFAIIFYSSTNEQKSILVLFFSISYAFICVYFVKPEYLDFCSLFIFLVFVVYPSTRNIILIISLILLLPIYFFLDIGINFFFPLLGFALFIYGKRNEIITKLTRTVIILLIIICIKDLVFIFIKPWSYKEDILNLIFDLLIIPILLRYRTKWVLSILMLAVIPLILALNLGSVPKNEYSQKQNQHLQKQKDIEIEKNISKPFFESERPIAFAEIPVDKKSPFEERIGMASVIMGFYLQKMIVPYPMGYYYGYAYFNPVSIFEILPIIFLTIHIGLFILALFALKKHKILSFGILFYLISIALFSGYLYPVVGLAGDRFTYTASLGFCIAISYIMVLFISGKKALIEIIKPSPIFITILILILLIYGIITLNRNSLWSDPLTLMSHDIEYLDESAQAHNLYALNLMRESFENKKLRPEQQMNMRKTAIIHFDKALEIWPEFFNAAYDKGRASVFVGDYPSAIDGFEKAVTIGPEEGFFEPYIQLSQLYLQTGRYPDYLRNAKTILKEKSEAESYNIVARGFYMTGRSDSAKIYLHRGMDLFPQDISLRKNIAEIFKTESQQDSLNYYLAQ